MNHLIQQYQELFTISQERARDIFNNAKKFVNGIPSELQT
jgi:hypothetical protein